MRLAEHTGQLKYVIESPMPKPYVVIMLRNIIVADQQISGGYDLCLEGCLRLLFPNNGSNFWHRHHDLR
jgi:hypothetical protein